MKVLFEDGDVRNKDNDAVDGLELGTNIVVVLAGAVVETESGMVDGRVELCVGLSRVADLVVVLRGQAARVREVEYSQMDIPSSDT